MSCRDALTCGNHGKLVLGTMPICYLHTIAGPFWNDGLLLLRSAHYWHRAHLSTFVRMASWFLRSYGPWYGLSILRYLLFELYHVPSQYLCAPGCLLPAPEALSITVKMFVEMTQVMSAIFSDSDPMAKASGYHHGPPEQGQP